MPSGIGRAKSIGLTGGILLPAEAVESNRSRPNKSGCAKAQKYLKAALHSTNVFIGTMLV